MGREHSGLEDATMTVRERSRRAWAGISVRPLLAQPICMSFSARYFDVPFRRYAEDHRVLADAQLEVADDFGVDIVSLTSDPCREASDCGAEILWFEDEPPMPDPDRPRIRDREDLLSLRMPDPLGGGRMHECVKGVAYLRQQVGNQLPVMGWIEGPIAEGADLRGVSTLIEDMLDHPEFVHDLFEFVTEMEVAYAKAQVDAGADIIGIGDAAASLIGAKMYREFVWPYEKRMVDAVKAMGVAVRLHICGHIDQLLDGIAELDIDMLDVDSLTDLRTVREKVRPDLAILGNVDPVRVVQAGPPEAIRKQLALCHDIVGPHFIVGAGCEVPASTPHENFRALVEYAHAAG
ncbi:MAG: uroporphyrinogen decarboxylase family protein [Fimbriimonadaceae bacterium]